MGGIIESLVYETSDGGIIGSLVYETSDGWHHWKLLMGGIIGSIINKTSDGWHHPAPDDAICRKSSVFRNARPVPCMFVFNCSVPNGLYVCPGTITSFHNSEK